MKMDDLQAAVCLSHHSPEMPMLTQAVAYSRDSISSLVDGREEVSLSLIGVIANLLRFAGFVRCVDRSGPCRRCAATHAARPVR